MLVIFGHQFQRPLSKHSFHLITAFAVLMLYGLLQKGSHGVTYAPVDRKQAWLLRIPDVMIWIQTASLAGFLINKLHQMANSVRFSWLGFCWLLLLLIYTTFPDHLILALPFTQLDLGSTTFCILLLWSAFYHTHKDIKDFGTYIEALLGAIKTYTEPARPTTIPIDQESDAHVELQAPSIRRNSPAPGLDGWQSEYAQWDSGIQYEGLQNDEIRIIKILDTSTPDDLQCTLTHHPMAYARNAYTAVSYHWGDQGSQTMQLTVNGHEVRVPANLCSALQEIHAKGHNTLWVDALSINQSNLDERSVQVSRMGDIFQQAEKVVAWLGVEDAPSRRVIADLSRRHQLARPGSMPVLHVTNQRKPTEDDVFGFTSRRYWRRVWIISELANAADVIFLCCGEQFGLPEVSDLVHRYLPLIDPAQRQNFLGDLTIIREILNIRERHVAGSTLGLLEALVKTDSSRASMRHDKVFGLLGLVNDQASFLREGPDYNTIPDRLSVQMTNSYFSSKGSLDIILADPQKTSTSSLPTWCPDYFNIDAKRLDLNFVRYLSGEDERHRLGKKQPLWSATDGSIAVAGQSFEILPDDTLRVVAVQLGNIDGVMATYETFSQEPGQGTWRPTGLEAKKKPANVCPDATNNRHQSTFDAIARMLLIYCDKYTEYTKASHVPNLLFSSFFKLYKASGANEDDQIVYEWLEKNQDFKMHGKTLHSHCLYNVRQIVGNWFKAISPTAHMTTPLDFPYLVPIIAQIVREKLHFVTLQQGHIGWADRHAEVKDEIWMISGCSVPVVLRRQPGGFDKYSVIGRAYIDGFMDGSKWRDCLKKGAMRRIDLG